MLKGVTVDNWATFSDLGFLWKYEGVIEKNGSSCDGVWSCYKYRQAEMKWCLGGQCVYKYPWLKDTLYGDGDIKQEGGGV